ncbi:MAG: tetratricopeptide repeat protein, partial [Myxococcales bacterium]|nr:tetratricopeptide repeat protein [Myxococcales bacterium]
LAALSHDPAAARRRWLWVGGLVLAASVGSGALASRGATPAAQPCSGVDAELAAVWNDERSAAVATAIRATRVPYAEATWQRVEPALDRYAQAWTKMRGESCRAHADARESDRHYDLRHACLARRRTALDTLVALLGEATPADVENAARAAAALPPLATCADADALAAALPPPDDPAVARAVAAGRDALARAGEYEALGRYADARALVEPVRSSPEAAAYAPLAAEAALSLGAIELAATHHEAATAALSDALELSLRAGHLDVAAEAFARRIFTRSQSGAAREAQADVPLARALVERADDDQLRWLLRNNIGALHFSMGEFPEAQADWLAALRLKERVSGTDHFEYALALANLGSVATVLGDIPAAREYQLQGLAVSERLLGAEHPAVAQRRFNLAVAEHYSGRLDDAHAHMQAAVAAMARAYGADAEVLFNCFLQLAALANDRGAHGDALEFVAQADRVRAAHRFDDHPNLPFVAV